MREPRWKALLRKGISACVAAIEVYNKPVMPHRDETFAMLAVSAWELLLKARLLKEARNDLRKIQVMVPVAAKDGRPGKRLTVKRNRARNPETIGLGEAVRRVSALPDKPLDPACAANLWSLVEIRDNAVHFVNEDPELARRAHEAGSACVRNYVAAVAEWFDHDLSEHRFMILPLSFEGAGGGALAVPGRRSRQLANLIAYLDRASDTRPAGPDSPYAAAIRVETRIVGNRVAGATAIRLGGGPDALKVALTDEQIADRWPMDYEALVKRVRALVPGLKVNQAFHRALRPMKGEQLFVFRRRLDPRDPKCTSVKEFYSDAAVDALVRALVPATG